MRSHGSPWNSAKDYILANIGSNILMALFTVVSIPAMIPFLQILFDRTPVILEEPPWVYSINGLVAYGKYSFSQFVQNNGRETTLVYVCTLIVLLFFLKNLFRYLSLFFMAPVRNGMVKDIRQQLFRKLLDLPLAYFSETRKGDLMARMTVDVQEIESSILSVLAALVREPLIIIGCLAVMIYFSPALMLFVLLLLLFTILIIGGIGKRLKRSSAEVQAKLGMLANRVEEALSGLRIIKGFNAEAFQEQQFAKENQAYQRSLTRLLWRRDLSSPLSEFLGVSVVAVLLWFGSRQVFAEELSAETFFAFLYAFFNVIAPAKSFSSAFFNIQKGMAAVDRVEQILQAPEHITSPAQPVELVQFGRAIEYRKVSFAYNDREGKVLDQIDLTIPAGKILALVGPSGAGKSTFVDLLPRFYEVSTGGIFIDGVDIKSFRLKDLRSLMGIVSQDAILFNDTIYNNIVFGLEQVSEAEVIEAAKVANAHEFIMATEQGYQTIVGDRGTKLSGGQRQRITIARAVLKNPPILILDEATSALDSESERLVQAALIQLMQNRTAIVIAHRLSTIQHADEIIVLESGKIIERGSHEHLLQLDGVYRKLVDLQAF
ncbi:MAG: ABC transporter transmembrane domain-containing protein [Bacteroidota bacterium]